jgi:hypothetical protein
MSVSERPEERQITRDAEHKRSRTRRTWCICTTIDDDDSVPGKKCEVERRVQIVVVWRPFAIIRERERDEEMKRSRGPIKVPNYCWFGIWFALFKCRLADTKQKGGSEDAIGQHATGLDDDDDEEIGRQRRRVANV